MDVNVKLALNVNRHLAVQQQICVFLRQILLEAIAI